VYVRIILVQNIRIFGPSVWLSPRGTFGQMDRTEAKKISVRNPTSSTKYWYVSATEVNSWEMPTVLLSLVPRGIDSLMLTWGKTWVDVSYCLFSIKFRPPWLDLNFSMENVEHVIRTLLDCIAAVEALSFLVWWPDLSAWRIFFTACTPTCAWKKKHKKNLPRALSNKYTYIDKKMAVHTYNTQLQILAHLLFYNIISMLWPAVLLLLHSS
jgi:hypothetical protein